MYRTDLATFLAHLCQGHHFLQAAPRHVIQAKRDATGALSQSILSQSNHLLNLLLCGRLIPVHGPGLFPQGSLVSHQHRLVNGKSPPFLLTEECFQIFRRTAAIAPHRGGNPLAGREYPRIVLPVHVTMDINESRRDNQSPGIYDLFGFQGLLCDLRDLAILKSNIPQMPRLMSDIHNHSTVNRRRQHLTTVSLSSANPSKNVQGSPKAIPRHTQILQYKKSIMN